jgi:hypothetical protein
MEFDAISMPRNAQKRAPLNITARKDISAAAASCRPQGETGENMKNRFPYRLDTENLPRPADPDGPAKQVKSIGPSSNRQTVFPQFGSGQCGGARCHRSSSGRAQAAFALTEVLE